MKQETSVPYFNVLPADTDEVICEDCGETVRFTIDVSDKGAELAVRRCSACFTKVLPEYELLMNNFTKVLDDLVDNDSHMTNKEMHELYGDKEE